MSCTCNTHYWGKRGPGDLLSPASQESVDPMYGEAGERGRAAGLGLGEGAVTPEGPRQGGCHRLPSGMEGVPQSRGSEGPGAQAKPKSPPIKKRVDHGCGVPRERDEVSQVQRVHVMEGTQCRVSHRHRAQHPQEGDSRGGDCSGRTWPRLAAAPCGRDAAGGPQGRSRLGSRRCARTARCRGRGRRARPAPAARTPEPWPRPRRTGSGGAGSGGEALAVGGGAGRPSIQATGHDWPKLGGSES